MGIHPDARIEEGAEVAADAEVGPFAVVSRGARVGAGCVLGPHAVVFPCVRLGAGCRVHAGAILGDVPQDLSFGGGESYVEIGASSVIREGVTIHRGTKPGTSTVVGEGCFLMANSHLAHNVRLGRRVILANGALLAGYVEVGDGAFVSGNAVIHQFARIGRLAMLSGLSAIGKDVPPFCIAAAAARNSVSGLNVVGMRRAGLNVEQRRAASAAFQILYRSGLNARQALDRLRAEFPDGPGREIADFVAASKRGICPFGGDPAGEEAAD